MLVMSNIANIGSAVRMEDQKPRIPALPAGAFVALAASPVVGLVAALGYWWLALAAVAAYVVVAVSTPKRPPQWVMLVTAGALLTVCAASAQAHARIDWALGYMLAAMACAWWGAVVKATPPVDAAEAEQPTTGEDSAETPAGAAPQS
jgi:hypothetical protein